MKLSEIHVRDPFIYVEDGKYYLYGTRGQGAWGVGFGVDVFVSEDLETWSEAHEVFGVPQNDEWKSHMWAPEVHKYNGSYYMFVTFNRPMNGTYILKSDSLMGPFSFHSEGSITPVEWSSLDGTFYVENGKPYMVFCHEWTQIKDGEICGVELAEDLSKPVGEPFFILRASDLPPVHAISEGNYVTDGPFMYTNSEGKLLMIWSSFGEHGYLEAVAYSEEGIKGPWKHSDHLIFEQNGGHGMIFRTLDGELKFVCHQPNNSPNERPVIVGLEEKNGLLYPVK